MAPCRQLLMWSVPSIAVLLGIFWFKKKREYAKSDPGGRERLKTLQEELAEALIAQTEAKKITPLGKSDRSIIKSAPIDIIPLGSNSQRSSPLELTDEEIDMEIEKIIRKKSIEKEKRMSAGFDKQNKIVNSYSREASFVVQELQTDLYTPVKEEMSSTVNNKSSKLDTTVEQESLIVNSNETLNNLEVDSIRNDNAVGMASVSAVNTEEHTPPNTEEITLNHNIVDEETNGGDNIFSTTQSRHISERDSANHSPVDPMLVSPSMCHFSDSHSEVITCLIL